MNSIIKNVKPYPGPDGTAGNQYMFCIGHVMNILAYHAPLFENIQTFELLKLGWSFWHFPTSNSFRHAYTRGRVFHNLRELFNIRIEPITCTTPSEFRKRATSLIQNNRPLLLWIAAKNRNSYSDDGSDHATYVGCGIDDAKDAILMVSNGAQPFQWMPIGFVGSHLAHKQFHDFHVPEDCRIPETKTLIRLLKSKVEHNLYSHRKPKRLIQKVYWRYLRNQPTRDSPPLSVICGPKGIRSFADNLPLWAQESPDVLERRARKACSEALMLNEERSEFMAVYSGLQVKGCPSDLHEIENQWQSISKQWMLIARAFTRIYMTKNDKTLADLQDQFLRIADEEEQILRSIHRMLSGQ